MQRTLNQKHSLDAMMSEIFEMYIHYGPVEVVDVKQH